MKKYFYIVVIPWILSLPLSAEIQQVMITWAPQICQAPCAAGLQKYLSEIPEVAHADINQANGSATLTWKSDKPYSFSPINFATRVIGIPHILTARIRVRGTITHSQNTFHIISVGDNTAIQLLSPIQPQTGQYTIQHSLDTHNLAPETKEKLLELEREKKVVIIEGPIFEAVRLTYPAMIIQSIKNDEKK